MVEGRRAGDGVRAVVGEWNRRDGMHAWMCTKCSCEVLNVEGKGEGRAGHGNDVERAWNQIRRVG